MALVTQYLDTMKEIGALSSHTDQVLKDIASQIRDGTDLGNFVESSRVICYFVTVVYIL